MLKTRQPGTCGTHSRTWYLVCAACVSTYFIIILTLQRLTFKHSPTDSHLKVYVELVKNKRPLTPDLVHFCCSIRFAPRAGLYVHSAHSPWVIWLTFKRMSVSEMCPLLFWIRQDLLNNLILWTTQHAFQRQRDPYVELNILGGGDHYSASSMLISYWHFKPDPAPFAPVAHNELVFLSSSGLIE